MIAEEPEEDQDRCPYENGGGDECIYCKLEDGRIVKETICTLPGGESGAGEWCKEYCMFYGMGRCHYDPDFKRMLIRGEF